MDLIVRPESDNDLATTVRQAQEEIDRAIEDARLTRDPLRLPLMALRSMLGAMLTMHAANAELFRTAKTELDERIAAALSKPLELRSLAKLEQAAADGAERRVLALARVHNWKALGMAVAIGAALTLAVFACGWLARGDGLAQACASRGEIRSDKDGRPFCVVRLD